jgi:Leucine-rich repeat (LRR) protein
MELTFEGILQSHGEKPEKILGLEASKLKLTAICPLHPFTKLKSINLASNLIESLSNSQIDRLRDLKDLDVSCNSLRTTLGILNPGLVRLNIGFNKLEVLESLPKVIQM